jgi:glycolate oxidase
MNYSKLTNDDISFFINEIGEDYVFLDKNSLNDYSHDETEDLKFLPQIVLKPCNTDQVSKIMIYCNKRNIVVTPCGARTGLSGGSLPIYAGVALSLENFNKILQLDEKNLQATVEPGVINQVFRDFVEQKNLFYPPDPASKGSSFLGGNLAENSGGPKALKYGVTKDYVLNLEVVLPTGEIIWTGANVLKNSTGYDLTSLMIGSEGTLGIITKIVFKLIPLPTKDITMLVPFKSAENACEAVSAIFMNGITPSALEFIERDAIDWTLKYSDIKMDIKEDIQAHLLIEVDGNDLDDLFNDCEKISNVLYDFECGEILLAESKEQKDRLWRLRRMVGEAVKSNSIYKEEDTVVLEQNLQNYFQELRKLVRISALNQCAMGMQEMVICILIS